MELALIAPLLILLAMGAIDFGGAINAKMRLASAARAGVQYGAQSTSRAEDITGIRQAARNDHGDQSLDVTAERSCQCGSDPLPVACDDTCAAGDTPRMYVEVTVEQTYNTLFPWPFIDGPLNLSTQAIMRAR